ncbi:MAG: putative peptidoglycan glycosyltransferase FtsW [Pseudomonadota bacterium]|nr:putative peptidoglycan glycosyltransferase FtsW [Pseudomonadota bacterium]
MTLFYRTDMSLLGRWWWTVDRWIIAAVIALMISGVILVLTASPPVAEKAQLETFHFVYRQITFVPIAIATMFAVSLLNSTQIRRLAMLALLLTLIAMCLTLFIGVEKKGAIRWIDVAGMTLQPSEFVKPTFAVVSAWIFSTWSLKDGLAGYLLALLLYVLVVGLLISQPDVGMAILISFAWAIQFFLAGLPVMFVLVISLFFIFGGFAAYFHFGHVQERIDRFINPGDNEAYQVAKSLEAFRNGGVFGRGPGEGTIKHALPDSHSDFIFAVAAEEFGMIAALILVSLFCFIVIRGFMKAFRETNLFVQLAVAGLLVQFGLQAIINLASTLNLMPTKGMTLPFISYGGSSLLALSFGMGMLLSLTRERPSSTIVSRPHQNSVL